MLLFRSLTVGLLGACLLLLLRIEPRPAVVLREGANTAAELEHASTAPTVVDVAAGIQVAAIPSLIRLAPGERVIAVDDRPVDSDLAAGAAITARTATASSFVDLTVERAGTHRRVLVLLH